MSVLRLLKDLDPPYYHYCSPNVFNKICRDTTLRFTSLEHMSDSLEMKWGMDLFTKVIDDWREKRRRRGDEEAIKFADDAEQIVNEIFRESHSLAVCLSRNGDMLSQWRAYAGDATGFSIGFDLQILGNTYTHTPLEILYKSRSQMREIVEHLRTMFEHYIMHGTTGFGSICGELYADLAAFKNPAFEEEKEIRLLRAVLVNTSPFGKRILENSRRWRGPDLPIEFYMKNGIPCPYVELNFGDGKLPIREVVIGPKNPSTVEQIEIFLETIGIRNVTVRKSVASYR